MFLQNKYSRWYFNIIQRAHLDVNNRLSGYFEKHHIMPKCMGGDGESNNIVQLTPKEHFVCHHLLVYMTTGKDRCRMSYALLMFTRNNTKHNREKVTARAFQTIRQLIALASSQLLRGRSVSKETRAKQSASKKITHNTLEVRTKLSAYHSNRTPEHQAKLGDSHKGKIISVEHRAKTSAKVAGELNPRALTWSVEYEDGRPSEQVKSLRSWCSERNIKYLPIYHRATAVDSPSYRTFHRGVRAVLTSDYSERKVLGWATN
jgi:hypothetical protein